MTKFDTKFYYILYIALLIYIHSKCLLTLFRIRNIYFKLYKNKFLKNVVLSGYLSSLLIHLF